MIETKKGVFSCFLIISMLGWIVLSKLFNAVAAYFDFFAYGNYVEIVVRLVPVVCGVGLFVGLYQNQKSNTYMSEVITELKKVTWPTSKDIYAATIAVIIAVLISSVVLFFLDSMWSFLIQKVIQYVG